MKTYEIEFTLGDKRYAETIRASSASDARRLIQQRYPNAVIWNVEAK